MSRTTIADKILPLFILCCVTMIPSALVGQEKLEREYRLDMERIPTRALELTGQLPQDGKVKWYYEQNLVGNSIEAKFRSDRQRISVEFDTLGHFQDLEIKIDQSDVAENAMNRIRSYLASQYSRWKITKIQRQLSGPAEAVVAAFTNKTPAAGIITHYEVVVKGKQNGDMRLYEILFDATGNCISTSRILLKSAEHLEY